MLVYTDMLRVIDRLLLCRHILYRVSCVSVRLKKTQAKHVKGVSANAWVTRHINDPYVIKAKRENYRARSAFKLLEIHDKCELIRPGDVVLDYGSSPGAWTQVACKLCNSAHTASTQHSHSTHGHVISVDRLSMVPVQGAQFLRGDITHAPLRATLDACVRALPRLPNVILSDIAPNCTGVHSMDHQCIVRLVCTVLRHGTVHLRAGGLVLLKLWSGPENGHLHDMLSHSFERVRFIKPHASRKDSSEIYLLASGYTQRPLDVAALSAY